MGQKRHEKVWNPLQKVNYHYALKKPGSLGAGLPAATPSESNLTISQCPEGLLRGSCLLILTTYNISAAASGQLTNTYFTAARGHLAAARDPLTV